MAGVTDPTFYKCIHDFLKVYLPKQRACSVHTIRAYRTALDQLLCFLKLRYALPLTHLRFDMLNHENTLAYLDWLEAERQCSVQTRNLRLAAIRSFLHYAAIMDVTTACASLDVGKIPLKKSPSRLIVDFMSEEALKAMLTVPDVTTNMGIRNRFLMVLLYDTAARVQELLDLRICDLRMNATPTATLTGKGAKVRTVPLMERTVELLKAYLRLFHPGETASSMALLFYIERKDHKQQMSDDNIRKFLHRYAEEARLLCPEVPLNVYPHIFRHSRAMHLYQHGMPLVLISQWLGHADLQTTLIYAHADTEQKRKAIEKANGGEFLPKTMSSTQINPESEDEAMFKRLYGLA